MDKLHRMPRSPVTYHDLYIQRNLSYIFKICAYNTDT